MRAIHHSKGTAYGSAVVLGHGGTLAPPLAVMHLRLLRILTVRTQEELFITRKMFLHHRAEAVIHSCMTELGTVIDLEKVKKALKTEESAAKAEVCNPPHCCTGPDCCPPAAA